MAKFSIDRWNHLAPSERQVAARQVEAESDGRFRWLDIQRFELGRVVFDIARFEHNESLFVLVPGGEITLGFDPHSELHLSAPMLKSWNGTADAYGIAQALPDYLRELMSPIRKVRIPTLVVETSAKEIGLEPIGLEDPDVREILSKQHNQKGPYSYEISQKLRVTRDDVGTVQAFRIGPVTHKDVTQRLDSDGFRLPTSDEWEYLCGAGTRTMFRWGDDCPCDRYPTDVNPAEAAWRRDWVISGGKLERPDDPFTSDWDLHTRPNAFGLQIATNPYESEIVTEERVYRGGDGGCSICGGMGYFAGWLPLATAYLDPNLKDCYDDSVTETRMRRIWTLG